MCLSNRLLLTLYLSWPAICIHAQPYSFSQLGVEHGLSQNSVYCIFQDSKGFMWFGTGDGLNRYDGHQFAVFKNNPADSFSICNNSIRKITEDSSGHLWIGTDGGLNEYVPEQKKFVFHKTENMGSAWPMVYHRGKTWFWAQGRGLGNIDVHTRHVTSFYNVSSYNGTGVGEWTFDAEKESFLFASNKGLLSFNIGSSKSCSLVPGFERTDCSFVFRDRKKRCWVASDDTIWLLENNALKRHVFSGPGNGERFKELLTIAEDNAGKIWVGSYGKGVYQFDERTHEFNHLPGTEAKKDELVKFIYKDRIGNMWIGTDGKGVKMWSPYLSKFRHYSTSGDWKPQPLSSDFIKCFAQRADGKMLIGTYEKGLNICDPLAGTNHVTTAYGGIIHAIHKDVGGQYWVIADDELKRYDSAFSHPEIITIPQQPYPRTVRCITTDLQGNAWIGCSRGLFFRRNNDPPVYIEHSDSFRFYAVFIDSRKRIWLASDKSVHMLPANGSLSLKGATTYPDVYVRCFLEQDGTMWMTGPRGLLSCRIEDGAIRHYGTDEGLPNLMLYGILDDGNHQLWISSNKGLSCLNPATGVFRNYDLRDGLQSYEFNTGAYFKAKDGTMYFGGVNGFNCFDPMLITNDTNAPVTVVSNIKLFDTEMQLPAEPFLVTRITLPYDQNILSFEFSSLQFTDVARNEYSYRMIGMDTGWVFSGRKNFARYANMPPGEYELQVKSANCDGVWSTKAATLQITILPPWWKLWWFIVLVVLAMLAMVYLLVRAIVNRKIREQQQIIDRQKAIEAERARISKDMHDDIGSGLSKIAIMSQLLKTKVHDNADLDRNVEKISSTAGDLVDSMGQIVWAMNPHNDNLENLLSYLREFALDYFDDFDIRCTVDFPDDIQPVKLSQQERRNIFLVVKETLNNILKYAGATHVNMGFAGYPGYFTISIMDDGKGFDTTQTSRFGNGLINMKKRMEELGGTYCITSKPGEGTRTEIRVQI